jgi:ABC-type multidrug transport system fused ATPase/permease subunit
LNTLRLLFSSLFRIWAILPGRLRRNAVILFVCMLLLGILELASVMSLTFFAGVLNAPEHIAHSRHMVALLARFPILAPVFADVRHCMLYAAALSISLIILKNLMSALVAWKTGLLGGEVAGHVGREIMHRYVHMPYDWHISALSADAFTKMSWRHALGQVLIQNLVAYSNFITAGLLFFGLFLYAPGLTALVIGVMTVAAVCLFGGIRKGIDRASVSAAHAQGEESRATMAAVRGIREILIYQQQPTFLRAIARAVGKGIRPQAFLGVAPSVPSWGLESAGFLLIGLTLAWLALAQDAGRAEITANIAMLTLTAWRVLPSLNRAVGAVVNIRANQPMGLSCLTYMENLAPAPEQAAAPEREDFALRKSIRLHNVSYRYPGAKEYSLRGITLEIPRGACVGFVGMSGAGKSTLVNILSGLLRPTQGSLLVDDREMSPEFLAAYRRKIGYVPQNPYLLSGTVAENVTFSEWGRPPDEQRLRLACRQAEMDFLGDSFEGLHRVLGEGGSGLSGGQIQRVTIARALYAEPSVLIFDEATSSLDHLTEESIRRTINDLPRSMTRILIAHRLTALDLCDAVYWLKNGTLIRQGPAREMVALYKAAERECDRHD